MIVGLDQIMRQREFNCKSLSKKRKTKGDNKNLPMFLFAVLNSDLFSMPTYNLQRNTNNESAGSSVLMR